MTAIFVDYDLTLAQIKESFNYIMILNNIIKDIIKINGYCSLKMLIKTVQYR